MEKINSIIFFLLSCQLIQTLIILKVKNFTSIVKNVNIPANHDLKPRHPIFTEDLEFLQYTLRLEKRLLLWSGLDEYLCCPSLELKMEFSIAVLLKSDGNCKKMKSLKHEQLTETINHRKNFENIFLVSYVLHTLCLITFKILKFPFIYYQNRSAIVWPL